MSSKLRQQVEAQMNKQKRSAVAYNKQEDRYPHPKEQERQQKQPRVFSDKLDKSLDAIMAEKKAAERKPFPGHKDADLKPGNNHGGYKRGQQHQYQLHQQQPHKQHKQHQQFQQQHRGWQEEQYHGGGGGRKRGQVQAGGFRYVEVPEPDAPMRMDGGYVMVYEDGGAYMDGGYTQQPLRSGRQYMPMRQVQLMQARPMQQQQQLHPLSRKKRRQMESMDPRDYSHRFHGGWAGEGGDEEDLEEEEEVEEEEAPPPRLQPRGRPAGRPQQPDRPDRPQQQQQQQVQARTPSAGTRGSSKSRPASEPVARSQGGGVRSRIEWNPDEPARQQQQQQQPSRQRAQAAPPPAKVIQAKVEEKEEDDDEEYKIGGGDDEDEDVAGATGRPAEHQHQHQPHKSQQKQATGSLRGAGSGAAGAGSVAQDPRRAAAAGAMGAGGGSGVGVFDDGFVAPATVLRAGLGGAELAALMKTVALHGAVERIVVDDNALAMAAAGISKHTSSYLKSHQLRRLRDRMEAQQRPVLVSDMSDSSRCVVQVVPKMVIGSLGAGFTDLVEASEDLLAASDPHCTAYHTIYFHALARGQEPIEVAQMLAVQQQQAAMAAQMQAQAQQGGEQGGAEAEVEAPQAVAEGAVAEQGGAEGGEVHPLLADDA